MTCITVLESPIQGTLIASERTEGPKDRRKVFVDERITQLSGARSDEIAAPWVYVPQDSKGRHTRCEASRRQSRTTNSRTSIPRFQRNLFLPRRRPSSEVFHTWSSLTGLFIHLPALSDGARSVTASCDCFPRSRRSSQCASSPVMVSWMGQTCEVYKKTNE